MKRQRRTKVITVHSVEIMKFGTDIHVPLILYWVYFCQDMVCIYCFMTELNQIKSIQVFAHDAHTRVNTRVAPLHLVNTTQ